MAETDSIMLPYRATDLMGQKFGRLLVLRYAGTNKHSQARWHCKCDCGKDHTVGARELRNRQTQSCGCLHREIVIDRLTTHGMSHLPEHSVWGDMLGRCHTSTHASYCHYGGRGITVCDRWKNSFIAFFKDMGYKPFPKAQIDRIDNNGNYEPGNCRWVLQAVNCRNSSYAKLSMQKAKAIRALYKAGGILQREIGLIYGVSDHAISDVVNNKAWT